MLLHDDFDSFQAPLHFTSFEHLSGKKKKAEKVSHGPHEKLGNNYGPK